MDLDVLFLGTAGSHPTAGRNTSATLLRRGGERILVDCGEGTQRRLMQSVAGFGDIGTILLTHGHGDHYLGLPGMLRTWALRDRDVPLALYGPPGTRALMRTLEPLVGRLPFPLAVVEIEPGGEVLGDGYRFEASPAVHRGISLSWSLAEDERPGRFDVDEARRRGVPEGPLYGRLQRGEDVHLDDGTVVRAAELVGEARRGRRIVLSGDTRPCDAVLAAALGADLLIHEATFLHEDRARARETQHSTAEEAARLALEADVALLALQHLSPRYPARAVRDEARAVFARTVVPRDLDRIVVPFPERGEPQLERAGGREGAEAQAEAPADG
jgi:ribonuclease Z